LTALLHLACGRAKCHDDLKAGCIVIVDSMQILCSVAYIFVYLDSQKIDDFDRKITKMECPPI